MNTQIIKVYYGGDALPYKDKERTVHFPITGSTFVGSSDTTKIRLYVDGYLADENALWISVSKRADGTQGSQFLTSGTDESGDKYREMTLSGWYTEKKGDLYISLKGYQGGSTGYWDEETGMYVVQGVPVIRATGSIKLAINYAPVGEYQYYQDEMASFQDLVAQLGNKLNITSGIVVVTDISTASAVLYTEGQLLYSKADKKLYQLANGNFVVFFEIYDKDTLDTKFSGKVDKLSTSGKYAYTHEGSTQGETQVSENVVNGAIPSRTSTGQILVPETPLENGHASSKKYVDDSISTERTFLLGKINDAGHSLGLVESTDPSKEYDYIIQLKDKANNVISSVELDLPLEQIITDGSYDNETKEIILTLDNGSEVRIPVGDLVEGLIDEQGLQTALQPYIKELEVSSVLTTNDLLQQIGVGKNFILDNIGDTLLSYISEESGTYTLSIIGKDKAYHSTFSENTLVINLLSNSTLDINYLPIIELTNAMQTLTSSQMQIANQDNAIIKYSGRLYLKGNDSGTTLDFVSVVYDIVDEGANNKITKYEIIVNKSNGATNMITTYLNVYSVGEMDALLNEKANTSGDYPLLKVGKSLVTEQIENVNDEVGSTQTNPFLFQGTGTNNNTTETPTAPVAKHLELRGNTVVWNQLVGSETSSLTLTSGHKYLTKISGIETIITSSGETISVTGGTDQVFDLTLLGKEYDSVLAFNRDYPLPYYEYNAGELKSCSSSKLITIGCNALVEQPTFNEQLQTFNATKFTKLIAGYEYVLSFENISNATTYRWCMSVYDVNGNIINDASLFTFDVLHYFTPNNLLFTSYNLSTLTKSIKITPKVNCYIYVNYGSGNVSSLTSMSQVMLRLSWNESHDYVDYIKHEYDLPEIELRSAGSVYDVLYSNGTGKRRIGTRTFTTDDTWLSVTVGDFVVYYILNDNQKKNTVNIVCSAYSRGLGYISYLKDKEITGYGGNGYAIWIRDDSVADATAMKNKMNGVTVYFELENEEDIETTSFAKIIEVDDFGTMEFAPSDSTEEVIIPQGNKFFYPADYVLFIDDMYNRSKDGGETSDANNFVTQRELQEAISEIPTGDFVNLTGTQTISGDKNHTGALQKNGVDVATTDQAFNVINASDITNNILSADQYALIRNGKPTLIKGTFLNMLNPILLTSSYLETFGIIIGANSIGNYTAIKYYEIYASGSNYVIQTYGNKRIELSNLYSINGKEIPDFPSSTGTFVLKCVNGTLTWVAE